VFSFYGLSYTLYHTVYTSQEIIDYASIPPEEMNLQIKMVLFGSSTFVGSRHLVKLISANSLRQLFDLVTHLRGVFGEHASSFTRTGRIEARYFIVF
jgi:hypothetical protein